MTDGTMRILKIVHEHLFNIWEHKLLAGYGAITGSPLHQ